MGLSRTIASLEKDAITRNGVISSDSYDEMAPPPPALSDQNQINFINSSTTGQSPRNSEIAVTASTSSSLSTLSSSTSAAENLNILDNNLDLDKDQFLLIENIANSCEFDQTEVNTIPKSTDEGQQATDCPLSTQKMDEIPMGADIIEEVVDGDIVVEDDVAVNSNFFNIVPNSQAGPSNSQSSNPDVDQALNLNDPDIINEITNFLTDENLRDMMQSIEETGGNGDNLHEIDPNVSGQFELIGEDSPQKNTEEIEKMEQMIKKQKIEEENKEAFQLNRKMEFMMRRLQRYVAKNTSLHASEEMAGFVEHVARHNKKREKEPSFIKAPMLSPIQPSTVPPVNLLQSPSIHTATTPEIAPISNMPELIPYQAPPPPPAHLLNSQQNSLEKLKPVSSNQMKSFLKKIANLSAMQNTMLPNRGHAAKYFSKNSAAISPNKYETIHHSTNHSHGKMEPVFAAHSTIPKFDDVVVDQLNQTSGLLHHELREIEKDIDSDATESSSGGESADEMIVYNNPHQQFLSM